MALIKYLYLIFGLLLIGCASGEKKADHKIQDGFPDSWWQTVAQDRSAHWEIPPQAADRTKSEVVLSKRNELGQFSNLYPVQFNFDGEVYGSVEGLWQSLKYPENLNDERLKNPEVIWPYSREQVMGLSGFEAKRAGDRASENMKKLNIKWVTYKGKKIFYSDKSQDTSEHYALILRACRAKLKAKPELVDLLRSTKNLTFLSDHRQPPDVPPAYKYHEIYMKLRSEYMQSQIDAE